MWLRNRDVTPVVGLTTSKSVIFFTLTILFFLLASIFVALRIYARKLKRKTFGIDDYLIFTALFCYTGQTTCTLIQILLGGAGHHVNEIHDKNVQFNSKACADPVLARLYSAYLGWHIIRYYICVLFTKIFFIKSFKIATWTVMGFNIAWGFWASVDTWILCTPIAYSWDPTIPGGHCVNRVGAYISVGVIDVVVDICIFLLPIPMVWNLQMPRRNKIGVLLIFGVGIITIIISCLRTQSYTAVALDDFTYSGTLAFLWTQIGPGVSFMVASSLVLRPVFEKLFHHPLLSYVKRPKENFTMMDDDQYQLQDIRSGQPSTAATAFAGQDGESDTYQGSSSRLEAGEKHVLGVSSGRRGGHGGKGPD